ARRPTPGGIGCRACRGGRRRGALRVADVARAAGAVRPRRSPPAGPADVRSAHRREQAAAERAAGCAAAGWTSPLAGLPVQRVAAAPTAVLAELDAVGRVPLRLL